MRTQEDGQHNEANDAGSDERYQRPGPGRSRLAIEELMSLRSAAQALVQLRTSGEGPHNEANNPTPHEPDQRPGPGQPRSASGDVMSLRSAAQALVQLSTKSMRAQRQRTSSPRIHNRDLPSSVGYHRRTANTVSGRRDPPRGPRPGAISSSLPPGARSRHGRTQSQAFQGRRPPFDGRSLVLQDSSNYRQDGTGDRLSGRFDRQHPSEQMTGQLRDGEEPLPDMNLRNPFLAGNQPQIRLSETQRQLMGREIPRRRVFRSPMPFSLVTRQERRKRARREPGEDDDERLIGTGEGTTALFGSGQDGRKSPK